MSHMESALLVFCVLGAMAVFFIGVGIYSRRYYRRREEEQTGQTTGVIVGVCKRCKGGGRTAAITYWHPVIRYTAEGREYEREYPVGQRLEENVVIGKTVDVFYDPAYPDKFHLAGDDIDDRAGKQCIIGGLLGLAGAAVLAILYYT